MTRFFVVAWTSYCRLIGSTVTHGTWRLNSLKQVRTFGIRDSSGLHGARATFFSGDFVPRVIYHRMAAWSTSLGLSHDRRTGAWKCGILLRLLCLAASGTPAPLSLSLPANAFVRRVRQSSLLACLALRRWRARSVVLLPRQFLLACALVCSLLARAASCGCVATTRTC